MESLRVCAVWKILKRVAFATTTCVFAVMGALVGLIVGAVHGHTEEMGCVQGARSGAFNGVILSIEILDSTIVGGPLSLKNLFLSMLKGKIFQESIASAIQVAYRRQTSMVDITYDDHGIIFDVSDMKGMPENSIVKLPEFVVTTKGMCRTEGESYACTICLEELNLGDTAKGLPKCRHHFHARCIDRWLTINASCPACREGI